MAHAGRSRWPIELRRGQEHDHLQVVHLGPMLAGPGVNYHHVRWALPSGNLGHDLGTGRGELLTGLAAQPAVDGTRRQQFVDPAQPDEAR